MKAISRKNAREFIRYAAVLSFLAFPVFYNLGELPVRVWDESRLAINAWEMHSNNKWLVTHFGGSPDMWNTKPPLMIWMQALSIRLFGLSEICIRLPAALSALLTCLALIVLCHRYFGKFWLGAAAAFILVTIDRYNGHHVARTGDYDALLILFLVLSAAALFLYTEWRKSSYLFLSMFFFGLAIAAKGVAAILMLPGLIIYLAMRRQLLPIFRDRSFWMGSVFIGVLIALLYGGRELMNPGYLEAVFRNEIGGRFFQVNEGHVGGPLFYLDLLVREYWFYFLPVILLTLLSGEKDGYFRLTRFLLITGLSFLLALSAAETKLDWYVAPIYPLMALLIAIGLYRIYTMSGRLACVHASYYHFASALIVLLLCIIPARRTIIKVAHPKVYDYEEWQYEMSYYLRNVHASGIDLSGYYFIRDQYQPHIDFYIPYLRTRGIDIAFGDVGSLKEGDKVIFWEDPIEKSLSDHFEYEILEGRGDGKQVRRIEILSAASGE